MTTPTILFSNRIAHAALVLAGMGFAVPAIADEVNQIAVYGEVAPRCWVADPLRIAPANAVPQVTAVRAICNHARPVLASEVRMIASDGALMKRMPAATDRTESIPARTALEIVVTPQL